MNSSSTLSGKKITVRRLFKQDIDIILNSFKEYEKLYYTPITPVFIYEVLLYGEFWAAFNGDEVVGCTYFFNPSKSFFKSTHTYYAISDAIGNSLDNYLLLGYTYVHDEYKNSGVYSMFYRLAALQAIRQGLERLVYCTPVKIPSNIDDVFKNGFLLKKIRGLDNLVVHYIFEKSLTQPCKFINSDKDELIPSEQTYTISKLLEMGLVASAVQRDEKGTYLRICNA